MVRCMSCKSLDAAYAPEGARHVEVKAFIVTTSNLALWHYGQRINLCEECYNLGPQYVRPMTEDD